MEQTMNDTTTTIVGNLVDDPTIRETGSGVPVANFRIASTSRRFDRREGKFVDNPTLYMTVTVWRDLARNVAASLAKGQQVIVTGRLQQRDYEVNETRHVSYALEATSVGHDLARGVTTFERRVPTAFVDSVEVDDEGRPRDESARFVPDPPGSSAADAGDPVDAFVSTAETHDAGMAYAGH
jgi:single-strand DNA-binding protein